MLAVCRVSSVARCSRLAGVERVPTQGPEPGAEPSSGGVTPKGAAARQVAYISRLFHPGVNDIRRSFMLKFIDNKTSIITYQEPRGFGGN